MARFQRGGGDYLPRALAGADQRRRQRFIDLVGDFLSRMRSAGYPNTTQVWEEGRWRKTRHQGWHLVYDDTDKVLSMTLTVDGRMLKPNYWAKKRPLHVLVPYRDAPVSLRDEQLDKLADSMVAKLVTPS